MNSQTALEKISDFYPLKNQTKEESRIEFEKNTRKLDLKHTFSFDEVYDELMNKRLEKEKKESYRIKIIDFENKLKKKDSSFAGKELPVKHTFADGMYIRQLTVPAKILTVTKIHKRTHPFFLIKGTISILTENGVETISAPYSGITTTGTKRVIYHHDEVIITTVHETKEQDLDKIENEVIAKTFNELPTRVDEETIIKLFNEVSNDICNERKKLC